MPAAQFPDKYHPQQQEVVRKVVAAAKTVGVDCYLVGGYVRDALSGRFGKQRAPHDFDFCIARGSAVKFAEYISSAHDGHLVVLDADNDTARVVLPDNTWIDLAGCVGADITSDINRRDFSINALVWDPSKPDEIMDRVGGLDDLARRCVRAISEQAFIDDPLRLLRAFRFSAALGFSIDAQTMEYISKHADLLDEVAGERINYELFLTLESENSAPVMKSMADCGLLEVIFTELRECRKVTPNSYHHLALFDHSVEAMVQSERVAVEMPSFVRESASKELAQGVSRMAATKLASLLHDIGKPATWVITEEGKHTFIGHDKLGALMCEPIAERLKWSRPVEKFITNLIRWHLRPGALFHQGPPTDKAKLRFYRNIGQDVPELMVLAFSDFRATCGPGLKEGRELLEKQFRELLEGYAVFLDGQQKLSRLMDGSDVMQLLGISPGPVVGEMLEELAVAQGLREVQDRPQAEAFIKRIYSEKYSK